MSPTLRSQPIASSSAQVISEVSASEGGEREPLLTRATAAPTKPWYCSPRPLWLLPFAIAASISRGMTIAPRVEVYTQLACHALRPRHSLRHSSSPPNDLAVMATLVQLSNTREASWIPNTTTHNHLPSPVFVTFVTPPGNASVSVPSAQCLADPIVQSGAARLQTIMTTTMGLLSALTTGWWGQFGDRHGRSRVIGFSILGLLFTDLAFVVVSLPHSPLNGHGHKLLLLSPLLEGALGGWSTMNAAANAYLSDSTPDGSRAQIFSRLTGIFYLGLAVGPDLAGLIIKSSPTRSTTPVFLISAICYAINFLFVWFIIPESLSEEDRKRKAEELSNEEEDGFSLFAKLRQTLVAFLLPLAIFGPRRRGNKTYWGLTYLAVAYFGYLLCIGLFQVKYLYAEHVYSWGAEQLGYYISAMGFARALHLLVLMPTIISLFKPLPDPNATEAALLSTEITFDLILTRLSVATDFLSQVLTTIAPTASQPLFIAFTAMSSFGGGTHPASQSLALCLVKSLGERDDLGKLFGALAVVQAIGTTIAGPMLFGLVYSVTVARYAKAIYVVAAGILITSAALLFLVRPGKETSLDSERATPSSARPAKRGRGRSRTRKELGR